MTKFERRFWIKVKKMDDCWIWVAATNRPNGYGQIWINGRNEYAHRVSWVINFGPIKNSMFVLHRCDVPRCVNPEHLFLGHNKDNSYDMVKKGRSLAGAKNKSAKLTEANVKEIRDLYKLGHNQSYLAKAFRVNRDAISKIIRYKRWTHVA